jgi:anti-sigma B factor antagonist
MTGEHPDLSVRQVGAVIVVEFLDRRLIDAAHVEAVGHQLKELVKSVAKPHMLVSFERIEYFSSAALTVLIDIEKTIRKRGGQFRLSNLDPELNKLFILMKLNKVMSIHPTVEDALNSFGGK